VGISGWNYAPWRGDFYPPGLRQRDELRYAAERLTAIEVNGSFYALQKPASYQAWAAQTPDDFVFTVKGGRFITHMKKLRDVEVPLANFLASGLLALGPKLGPLLWQLPPNLGFHADRIAGFLDLLPRTTAEAARVAAGHDERMEGRAWATTDADRPMRHAVEVRHPSFETPQFLALLAERDVAVVTADTAGKWPCFETPTTDLAYVRLHGADELYVSGYTDEGLDRWAGMVRDWGRTRDVYVFFDNDVKVRAPYDALALQRRLGLEPKVPTDG
jgi:uncharacterized protein YecE (DUF72 family)